MMRNDKPCPYLKPRISLIHTCVSSYVPGDEHSYDDPLWNCLLDRVETGGLFVVGVNYDGVVVDNHVDGSDNDDDYGGGGDDHDYHHNEYDQEEEGDSGYHWVDGTPIGFLNWAEGEPNSADGNEAIIYITSLNLVLST